MVEDLGTLPGGTYSLARAISENGMVTGWSDLHFGGPDVVNATHAFLFQGGLMTDLGALRGDVSSYGYDVNSVGWVVGVSEGPVETQRAFLYADGKLYDLNDLLPRHSGWELASAYGVNERGQITGVGFLDGALRAFLLTPDGKSEP